MAGTGDDRARRPVDGSVGPAGTTPAADPVTDETAPTGSSDDRARLRGRLVTYGLVVGLLVGAWTNAEVWPVTSFRLFSAVRTDRTYGLELVAVRPDGHRETVKLGDGGGSVANPSHQLTAIRDASPATRRSRVIAMIDLSGLEVSDYRVVRLERIERRLDPDGGPSTEVARTVVAEVDL